MTGEPRYDTWPLRLSLFRPRQFDIAYRREITWGEFKEKLGLSQCNGPKYSKKSRPLWSPWTFKRDRRSGDSAEMASMLVLDFDKGFSVEDLSKINVLNSVEFLAATSWSHQNGILSPPGQGRGHLVLLLDRPVNYEEYRALWSWAHRATGSISDTNAGGKAKQYFMPGSPSNKIDQRQFVHNHGSPINVDRVLHEAAVAEADLTGKFDESLFAEEGLGRIISQCRSNPEGKYKCRCPLQQGSGIQSAFVRIYPDGRVMLRCTSERHDHVRQTYWLADHVRERFVQQGNLRVVGRGDGSGGTDRGVHGSTDSEDNQGHRTDARGSGIPGGDNNASGSSGEEGASPNPSGDPAPDDTPPGQGEEAGQPRRRRRGRLTVTDLLNSIPPSSRVAIETRFRFCCETGKYYRRANIESPWMADQPLGRDTLRVHINNLIAMPPGGEPPNIDHLVGATSAAIDAIVSLAIADGIIADPTSGSIVLRDGRTYLNSYSPSRLSPEPGEYPLIQDLIDVISGGVPEQKDWMLNWAAQLVQRPHVRGQAAIILKSPHEGIGKTLFGAVLREIIGKHNCAEVSGHVLHGAYTNTFARKLFVVANEIYTDGRSLATESKLKSMLTDEEIQYTAAYEARANITNQTTWLFTTNSIMPLRISPNDRRFLVIDILNKPAESYIKSMKTQIMDPRTGGFKVAFVREIEAFAAYLISVELTDEIMDSLARAPMTEAKKDLVDVGRDPTELMIQELMGDITSLARFIPDQHSPRGRHLFRKGHISGPNWRAKTSGSIGVYMDVIYEIYRNYYEYLGFDIREILNSRRFGATLKQVVARDASDKLEIKRVALPGTSGSVKVWVLRTK